MRDERIWSALFAGATAILMLGILLLRSTMPPLWALLIFPTIGASLAHLASRTSPNRRQIVWLETSTMAAACVVVLVLMVNAFLIDLFVTAFADAGAGSTDRVEFLFFVVLVGGAALLWWALERRIARVRQSIDEHVKHGLHAAPHTDRHAERREALSDAA